MTARKITRLKWAEPCAAHHAPPKGLTGTKAQGLGFEKKVAKALAGAAWGQWFRFEDGNGYGLCQPDFLTVVAGQPVIVEVKLTATLQGFWQLEDLYRPVVEHWLGRPVKLVQVCRNLVPGMGSWGCTQIDSLDQLAVTSGRVILPWLGRGSLSPRIEPWHAMQGALSEVRATQ